jgi:hypothetical protein
MGSKPLKMYRYGIMALRRVERSIMRSIRDFRKLGMAFALGSGAVGIMVFFRSEGSLAAVSTTLGIPFAGFLVFALYQGRVTRRLRRKAEMQNTQFKVLAKVSNEQLEILFGKNSNENPLAHVKASGSIERRVLLPRDHEASKQRILQGRPPIVIDDEIDVNDQWHS